MTAAVLSAPVLRPYQVRAEDDIFSMWDAGLWRVAISAATGAGKSVIFGSVCRRHLQRHGNAEPVILLAHRRELVEQAAGHFRRANPDLRVEVVIGASSIGTVGSARRLKTQYRWRSPQTRPDVIVTTPQTLKSAATMRDLPNPSLVIADEMHHYASVSFKQVMIALGCFSNPTTHEPPSTRLLGVTATPFREDYRKLFSTKGSDDGIFEVLAHSIDISWLISHRTDPETGEEVECRPGEGYLVPPRLRHLTIDGLDLSQVPVSRMSGALDFNEKALAEEMERVGAFETVAKAVISELPDGKGVIFAPTVKSSEHLAQIMTDLGVTCGHIDGTMKTPDRDKVINAFRNGELQWLSNVGIVSEGFDLPEIDTVVLARPTRSRIFFRQAVGRALRPAPGKDHAVVFDVAGASDGHSLAGVEALSDTEMLVARDGEQLTELLERTDRARRGWIDRITAHADALRERQEAGERSADQIRITAENYGSQLRGLVEFANRVAEPLDVLLDTTTEGIDLSSSASLPPAKTIDDLTAIEKRVADMVAVAAKKGSILEQLKTGMRGALEALKEDETSDVAQAMITGYVGSVRGDLFGEEDERPEPKRPGTVQGLKIRKGPKEAKPVFESRVGSLLRSSQGHLWAPIHRGKEVRGIAIAVFVGMVGPEPQYVPISWFEKGNEVDYIAGNAVYPGQDGYQRTISFAANETSAPNYLVPMAAWRKRPGSDNARAVAQRIYPTFLIPDNADAGFISDVIEYGQRNNAVNSIAQYVASQIAS